MAFLPSASKRPANPQAAGPDAGPRRTPPLEAFLRGFAKRCPRCGQGRLFRRWLTMVDRCPRCGLAFERGDGFWLGAMAVNLGATEAVFGAFVVIGLMMTWPDVPWIPLTVFGVLLNATVPFLFYPSSKTIFLAFDLVLHQAEIPDAPELEATEPSARLPRPDETAPRFLSSRRRAELVNDSARGHPAWPAPSPP